MCDGDAILRAVLADPADDAPRLVYADWLDEQGDPALAARADVIRRMIAVPTYVFTRDQSPTVRRPMHGHRGPAWALDELRPRMAALGTEWGPVREVERVTVRRGFAESVVMSVAAYLRLAGRLFASHPITKVDLHGLTVEYRRGEWVAEIVADPRGRNHWPVELFPEHPRGTVLRFLSMPAGRNDLNRAILKYGRRAAGVTVRERATDERKDRPAVAVS